MLPDWDIHSAVKTEFAVITILFIHMRSRDKVAILNRLSSPHSLAPMGWGHMLVGSLNTPSDTTHEEGRGKCPLLLNLSHVY